MKTKRTHFNKPLSKITVFTSGLKSLTFCNVIAKSMTEPENSNNKHKANKSTPKNRAVFVCSLRTPKERLKMACSSMVERIGKGLALCCFPCVAVSQPDTFYRQPLRSLAVVFKKHTQGLLSMLYKFLAVSRLDLRNTQKPISSCPRYTLRIQADSLKQAQAKIARFFAIVEVQGGNHA